MRSALSKIALTALLVLPTAALRAQDGLGKQATQVLSRYFGNAENWALKGLVLLSLGEHWHPVGAEMVTEAFQDRDKRLRVYALETLRRTRDDVLQAVMTPTLLDELVRKQLKQKNKTFRKRIVETLLRIAPDAGAEKPKEWARWWSNQRKTYQPTEWPAIPEPKEHEGQQTTTEPFIAKAFDLQAVGLDVAIVIDSTGSMQAPIDNARDAIDEIVAILSGIAPKFRLGLTHYRDLGDMSGGAKVLNPLSKKVKAVKERLSKLIANGGGDIPERVEKGLEVTLSKDMKWNVSANKVIVLIGDAPPHPGAEDTAVELAREARVNPGLKKRRGPTTGRKKPTPPPPFITSAIAIGDGAADSFRKIAEAGGGAFAKIHPRPGGGKRGKGGDSRARSGSETIAGHILSMSFGPLWRDRMNEFVSIYFEYRDADAF